MSERDDRYAGYWKPFIYYIVTLALLCLAVFSIRGEIRDLQRRVGQLEQEKR